MLLYKWHAATGQVPPVFVVTQMLDSLEDMGEWRRAVQEYQLVAPIFATMQDAAAYRIVPTLKVPYTRIYAEEQRENWAVATDLFVEMQKRCPRDEIPHHELQKIALGRYRLRQRET
ncbi:unnamed protein product [Hyaloperonospora brassicae]|uniref:Uncharacterized protein n=1 Tax=Hyaloperonospora brassicae TaxID=162125 RepID=A0AAV0TTY7_HYABA|nr:unnamed protein product [Hyaloperonospora brassicae]